MGTAELGGGESLPFYRPVAGGEQPAGFTDKTAAFGCCAGNQPVGWTSRSAGVASILGQVPDLRAQLLGPDEICHADCGASWLGECSGTVSLLLGGVAECAGAGRDEAQARVVWLRTFAGAG